MELVAADPKKVEALIVSHGHFDHYGGLIGFLDKFRSVLPADLTLYAGGEDNFCRRFAGGAAGSLAENGVLDRREIASRKVRTVLAENPVVVGHAFTTGKIKRTSKERVLPNTQVEFAMKDGLGCNASHYTPAELQGQDRAGRAHSRARHLLQHEGPRARGDQLLRPCRNRQFGAAGTGSVRRAEGARAGRRLPSRPGAARLSRSR